jgi:hypothetical protein
MVLFAIMPTKNTPKLLKEALEISKEKKLTSFHDVYCFMGIGESTFYDHFPADSEGHKDIATSLRNNKVSMKVLMREKWLNSDNSALQLGLMKIIGTDEEAHRLNGTRVDLTSKDKALGYVDPATISDKEKLEILKSFGNVSKK